VENNTHQTGGDKQQNSGFDIQDKRINHDKQRRGPSTRTRFPHRKEQDRVGQSTLKEEGQREFDNTEFTMKERARHRDTTQRLTETPTTDTASETLTKAKTN